MTNQIDHDYFNWLVSQIDIRGKGTYNDLFQRLHDTEFIWIVARDDNRAADGLYLRTEFLNGSRHKFDYGVSLLEVLIALSRRLAWTAGGSAEFWAWRLLKNLRLNRASDPLVGAKAERVEDILHALIWRTYERNGQGGFFPLKHTLGDQTKAEIWDQMNAYVNENI